MCHTVYFMSDVSSFGFFLSLLMSKTNYFLPVCLRLNLQYVGYHRVRCQLQLQCRYLSPGKEASSSIKASRAWHLFSDAALAQMSESVLLLVLHLHRCLNMYCSWCCTCTDVWIFICLVVALGANVWMSIAVRCCTCTDVFSCVLLLYLAWNLAALRCVKVVRLDKPLLSLCATVFFYSFILELCLPDRNMTVKASLVLDLNFGMRLDVYSYVIWVGI